MAAVIKYLKVCSMVHMTVIHEIIILLLLLESMDSTAYSS